MTTTGRYDCRAAAILLMGGQGLRCSDSLPKQFLRLSGKHLYRYSLESLLKSQLFDQIILVCHQDFVLRVQSEIEDLGPITVVAGGSSRQESSRRGIRAVKDSDLIMIHDAARPFLSQKMIRENIEAALTHKAVDTCIPTTDTLVRATGDSIQEIPDRASWFRGQTPQTFSYQLIRKAHEEAQKRGITNATDDCTLVKHLGHPIHLVSGSVQNIKITTSLDLMFAEQILLHRFEEVSQFAPLSLEGKIFAVTGAMGSIGQSICELLVREGAQTLELSRKQGDLTNPGEMQKIFSDIYRTHGEIDGLINTIGFLHKKPFLKEDIDKILQTVQVNFAATLLACRFAQLKDGGHVVNFSSSSYSQGRKGYAVYSATKAAIVNFTQGLAQENPHLFVNVLAPGRTNTPMRRNNFPDENPQELLSPKKVAQTVIDILRQNHLSGLVFKVKED